MSQLSAQCTSRRPDRAAAGTTIATMLAPRALACRHQQLSVEFDELDALIGPLVIAIGTALMGLSGSARSRRTVLMQSSVTPRETAPVDRAWLARVGATSMSRQWAEDVRVLPSAAGARG